MYDGTNMALTDQNYTGEPITGIYGVRIEGANAIALTAVGLVDNCNISYTNVPQPWIEKGLVVGGNLDCSSRFDYWSYTNGGYPLKSISPSIAPGAAYGQTVSK